MGVKRVYASTNSEPAMRVMACLYEKQLEFEFVHVNMKAGEHKRQPYLSINVSTLHFHFSISFQTNIDFYLFFAFMQPFGLVPAFEDGDLQLFGKNFTLLL